MVAETALMSMVSATSYLVSVQVATPLVGLFVVPPVSVLVKVPPGAVWLTVITADRVRVSPKSISTLLLTSVALTAIVPLKSVLAVADAGGCVEKINWEWTTSMVEPVLLLTALVVPIWVPLSPTVRSVSPSTERIKVWPSVESR